MIFPPHHNMPAVATNLDACTGCQACNCCPVDNISYGGDGKVIIGGGCIDCGACAGACPSGVIEMK